MKILHTVENYYPSVGGMQEVVQQLSERLVKLGHDVTVATSSHSNRKEWFLNGVNIVDFAISGSLVNGIKGNVEEYHKFLLNSDFDVIVNFAAQQWATDLMLLIINQIKAKKVFVPTGFSRLYDPNFQGYFQSMQRWMLQYDCNIFLSNIYRDIEFAREYGITKVEIVPNGAGEDEFLQSKDSDIREELNIPSNHFFLLHVGTHTGVKGHTDAIKIFDHAKIQNATLLIIANNNSEGGCASECHYRQRRFRRSLRRMLDHKQLLITPLPREKTVACFQAADLFLFPSQIECSPIVLFECMASKTPFITTDVGNSAEIIDWSGGGKLLKTNKHGDGFAQVDRENGVTVLEELYYHPEMRAIMAEKGFQVWRERFTWENITRKYEAIYKRLLEN